MSLFQLWLGGFLAFLMLFYRLRPPRQPWFADALIVLACALWPVTLAYMVACVLVEGE